MCSFLNTKDSWWLWSFLKPLHQILTAYFPKTPKFRWRKACESGNGMRVLADYISGMTDEFASRLYSNIFSPKQGGIQDSLHM